MGIELKEYVGATFLNSNCNNNNVNLTEAYTQTYIDENSLMADIEAIHSIITRNDTLYTPECIKQSLPYWTSPYERPVIMHHNEKDGKIIGRVKAAHYISESKRSGTPALELVANIGDEEGKIGIKNGTLATVSIGAIAHDIRCSICGTNFAEEGMCEHEKGEVYNGKRCYWIVNKIEPKEVSYVIVPSDIYAHNSRVYDAVTKKNNNEVKESMTNIFSDLIEAHGLNTIENKTGVATEEGTQVDEEVKPDAKVGENETVADESNKTEETTATQENEESVEENEESVEENEKSVEENEKSVEENEKSIEEETDIEKIKEKVKTLTAKITELEAEKVKLENQVKSEKALKEAAECELIGLRVEKKKSLIKNINGLREQLSLPLEDDKTLIESTEEILNSKIKSLLEFVEVQKTTTKGLSILESPVAVSEEKDNTIKEKITSIDVKESNDCSNIDFEATLTNILSSCF